MARVLLILPPWYRFLGEGFNEIPLGLCYLSAALKEKGHQAAVLNCDLTARGVAGPEKIFTQYERYKRELKEFNDPVWNRLRFEIERFKPDYVGIHTKTAAIKPVLKVAEIAKAQDRNITVVAGGVHATLLPKETAQMPNIDFVVKGEGEETFNELISWKESGEQRPPKGLTYKQADRILDTGLREPVRDIDSLSFPDRESLIDKAQYGSYAFGIIITSRGCPFPCTYCAAKRMWPGPIRYRSAESIIDEIKYVMENFGTKYFNFRDDTFTFNKKRAQQICQRIIDEKLHIAWRCDTRADSLDEELVKIMKRSGCVQASIGIESGSDRILKLVKKEETTEDIKRGMGLLKRYAIPVSAFIMVGFPTETREEALETLRFAESLNADTLALSIVTPYPGTEIYDLFRGSGLIGDDIDYSDFYHQSPMMGLANLAGEDYREFLDGYFNEVARYNRDPRRLIKRFMTIFASNPRAALERSLNYLYK